MPTDRNRLLLAGSVLAVIGGVVMTLPGPGEPGRTTSTAPPATEAPSAGRAPKPEAPVRIDPVENPWSPVVDTALRDRLDALKESYRQEKATVARIRLHGALDRLWADGPPLELLLHEAADHEAPLDYRLHFANRIRNAAKRSGSHDRSYLAESLRQIIDLPQTEPEARVGLAAALTAIDQSAETIRIVATLAEESRDDSLAAGAVAALSQVGESAAHEAVWSLAQDRASAPDQHAQTLAAALPPLARLPELPVEPLLQQIVAASSGQVLFETALQCVAVRAPSADAVGIVMTSWQRAERLSPHEMRRVREACRQLAARLESQFRANPSLAPEDARRQLESILHQTEPLE